MDERRFRLALVVILMAAATLRLSHLNDLVTTDPSFHHVHGNAAGFAVRAEAILGGDLLQGDEAFFYGPLYPYYLATTWTLVGETSRFWPRLIQTVLGLLTVVLVHSITRRLFDPLTGLVAAGVQAVYWPALFFEGLLVATSLATFLLAAGVALLLAGAESSRRALLIAAGVAFGLCCWGRGNVLLLLPVVALWLALRDPPPVEERRRLGAWRAGLLSAGAFTLGASLAILPVTARNVAVSGHPVLLVSQGGINFYIGNNPEAFGVFHLPPSAGIRSDATPVYEQDVRRLAEEARGRELSPSEVSSYWLGRGLTWLASEPLAASRLWWRKLRLFLDPYEVSIHRSAEHYREHVGPGRFLPSWGVLVPLTLLGLGLTSWTRARGLMLALILVTSLSVVAFFVSDRYRYPSVVLLVPFAAAGAVALVEVVRGAWRERRRPSTRALVVIGGVLVVTTWLHGWVPGFDVSVLSPEIRARSRCLELHRHGRSFEWNGDPERALLAYDRALTFAPGHVGSRLAKTSLLERAGRWDEAVAVLAPFENGESAELKRALSELRERMASVPTGDDHVDRP